VTDRSTSPGRHTSKTNHLKNKRYHFVKKGETLFSIATLYGIDYTDLARWNGIARSYRIYPGERLNLRPGKRHRKRVTRHRGKRRSSPKRRTRRTRRPIRTRARSSRLKWHWPVRGRLLKRFRRWKPGKKGINIAGRPGQTIRAAAGGEVLYSGSGLIRYGKLIIIRHNHLYVSTYAHNRKLYVKQGDKVKAGQRIADMGSTGTNRTMLHFEIRYRGKPVDPLRYLPR
jgi:lipoprotein NlpD